MRAGRLLGTTILSVGMSAILWGLPGPATAAPILLGPTPYLSFNDSPFAGESFAYFYLENFEDGVLNTPGVSLSVTSPSSTVTTPTMFTDSVDADDGSIDGSGHGASLYLGGPSTSPSFSSATFTFDETILGALPTHVGIVWTDVGFSTNPVYGFGLVSFEAFDATASSLGTIGPTPIGDGLGAGQTAEDRFFGVTNSGGISKITISMDSHDWELDHLQYGQYVGQPVPEPSTWLLFTSGLAVVGMILWKKRRA